MKLTAIYIQNFRSVKDATIEDINDFNVLIGKNNSGKSNVLSEIHGFFKILSNGSLVSSESGIGNISDFTEKTAKGPISISASFILNRDETKGIIKHIREERPQISTALEALPQDLLLFVRLCILPPPQSYSFVAEITLTSHSDKQRNWSLLQVTPASAEEIYRNYRDGQEAQRMRDSFARMLSNIDDDDWRMVRQERSESFVRRYMFGPGTPYSPEIMANVRRMIEASQSLSDFQTALRDRMGTLEEERRALGERPLTTPVQTFSGVEEKIPVYIRDIIRSILGIKILYLQEQRRQIGADEAQKILDLKMTRGRSETFTRIQSVVSQLLGVRIDAFRPDRPDRPEARFVRPGERMIVAEIDVDDFLVELNGSGIRESLRLILDTTFEEPDILLVEEPEIHLHPGLETTIMRFLKDLSKNCQIFITTHSTNFLDSGDYQRIYLITKEKTTSVEALGLKEAEERIPIELGIRLSSLFMYDRLVFVEGPSDELILRELCNTLSVNLSRGNVGFVILRGIGNLSYYAAQQTLEFLQKRNVEMVFLIDRDERADSKIARIKKSLGPNVVFFPTEPRELENYLMVPRALATYISERTGTTVNASDIESLLETKAEELKGYTVLKHLSHHLRPIYPDREMPELPLNLSDCTEHFRGIVNSMHTTAEEVLKSLRGIEERVESYLSGRWESGKLKLIPGTELLDEVFKNFNLRFVKLRDGPGLASKLDVSDFDKELSSILRRLDS